MAIDISCYTTLEVNLLNNELKIIRKKYRGIFDGLYIIYEPQEVLSYQQINLIEDKVERYQKETKRLIAEDFGLKNARSYFMIAVNDKSFSKVDTMAIADLLRKELGSLNIIVLLNGEDLI